MVPGTVLSFESFSHLLDLLFLVQLYIQSYVTKRYYYYLRIITVGIIFTTVDIARYCYILYVRYTYAFFGKIKVFTYVLICLNHPAFYMYTIKNLMNCKIVFMYVYYYLFPNYKIYYSLCSTDVCGFAVFQFSMDLCAFSYIMRRVKLRMYVSSLPYSTNLTYDKGIYFILFYFLLVQAYSR